MPIVFRNSKGQKLTFDELDGNFQYLLDELANAGLSPDLPNGKIYIGNNLNQAEQQTLNTSIVPETTDKNYVTDANLVVIGNTSGTNTGDNATNTTSNAYADAKVEDTIVNGVTDKAPSQNAVYDALATNNNTNAYSQSTGVYKGGVLSIGTPNTTFSISDGNGAVVDNSTGTNTYTSVSWSGKTNITATYVGSGLVSYVAIDVNGNVIQQLAPFTQTQSRSLILLGSLIHINLTNLDAVNNFQDVALSPANMIHDISHSLGIFNVSGNVFSANGSNLQLNKSAGYIYSVGSNWANNPLDPSNVSLPSLTALTFQYRFRNGTNGATGTTVNPNIYDVAGVSTSVPTSKFTIQRIYSFVSNNVKIQPGQSYYNTLAEAKASIQNEIFVTEQSIAQNGLLRGFLIVKQGMTSLLNTADCFFYEAGKFGSQNGIGGQSVSSLQNAYDNSLNPEITTDTTRGALSIKRGTASDTDTVLDVQNGAGIETFTVDGNGLIYSAQATANTPTFFSSAKKLISATGSLLGAWFQTLATKSTPVDADTLLTGDSANGYETKITTYTQLWTNYIKAKADATYNQIYTTSRYAKVDYVNGSDVTGLVQRQDKPFATLQACYTAVVTASASSSESWEIEVVGDKTFILNALEITAQKNNVTIIFKGNITNSIPNSEAKGLICETGNYGSSNWNIIFYNYTQTTNNGTWTGSWASSTIEFKTGTLKNGKNASKCYGITQTGTNNKLTADNLTWDITNDTSFTAYQYLTSLGTNFKMEIDTLNVIGAVTGSSVYRNFYYGAGAYIKINKVYWNPTNYTNLAYFAMNDSGGSADYIEINFFDQALDTNVKNNFYIFYQGVSTRCLRIETGNFLGNYASVVFTNGSIESLIVQNIVSNGRFLYALKCNLQINGQIKQYTASTTLTSLIYVQGGSKISGGKIIGNLTGVDPNSQGTIFVSKNGSDGTLGITIANCDVYNVGVPATSTVAVPCILHSGGTVGAQLFLYLQNCKMIQTIGNTNSNRSWINTNGFTTYVTAYILGDLYVNYGLTASNVNLTYQGNLNIEANLNA